VATSPLPPPYTPKAACISFGMWGRVLDVINHAKFQLDQFTGFGAPGGRKSLSPIDWRYRPYSSVRTNVLHCENKLNIICSTVEMYASTTLQHWRRYVELYGFIFVIHFIHIRCFLFPVICLRFFAVLLYNYSLTSDLENLSSSAHSHGEYSHSHGEYWCQVRFRSIYQVKRSRITGRRTDGWTDVDMKTWCCLRTVVVKGINNIITSSFIVVKTKRSTSQQSVTQDSNNNQV